MYTFARRCWRIEGFLLLQPVQHLGETRWYLVVCARITQRQNPLKNQTPLYTVVLRETAAPKPGSHEVRGSIPSAPLIPSRACVAASPFLLP